MTHPLRLTPLLVASVLVACIGEAPIPDGGERIDGGMGDSSVIDGGLTDIGLTDIGCGAACAVGRDLFRDVLSTRIELDLATHEGRATLRIAGSPSSEAASFETGDLSITDVSDGVEALAFAVSPERLDVAVAPSTEPVTIVVRYTFADHPMFEGWDPSIGVTFLWPDFCGNLFPCRSGPSDGMTFEMAVTGIPSGSIAVYPSEVLTEAPSYMPAIAVGDYTYRMLGTTSAGTEVGVYFLPGGEADALAGTAGLVGYFAFFESSLGAYAFGDRVASVSAPYGPGAWGGMEHHPFWHIATGAMEVPEFHAHEAAHGWFGDGVRYACWEDLVLSEGLATYLSTRAIEAVDGAVAADALWTSFARQLDAAVARRDTIALPDATCDAIDPATHPLWSSIPYMKGTFFLRAVERRVGRAALDAALRSFYEAHVGRAAHMRELIDAIEVSAGEDLSDLETGWLRSMGHPPLP